MVKILRANFGKIFFMILTTFFYFSTGMTEEIKVTSGVDQYSVYENHPIKGTVEITHNKTTPIDTSNFSIENKPLPVELIKEVKIGDNNSLIISIYRFELPSTSKGLHILPAINVKISGKIYQSIPSTYEVNGSSASSAPPNTNINEPTLVKSVEGGSLKLDAKVEGSSSLYPGQRTKLIYHYYFTGNIELNKEELPLLNPTGFLKIGEKDIQDYQEKDTSVRSISQEVEAIKPGTFTFGPSVVEGVAYQEDALGNRQYYAKKLSAEAPPITLNVKPFPNRGKPASFNGAVGQFSFNVSMLTSSTVNIGDKIQLSLEISGKTSDWGNLPVPELCCQPGFSGLFRPSDLPPVGDVQGSMKRFLVELRPLSTMIKEVPPIEFSYFDPTSESYKILRSKPISLTVAELPPSEKKPQAMPKISPTEQKKAEYPPPILPQPIEIIGNYPLSASDLENKTFGTWWCVLLIPIGASLLMMQSSLRKKWLLSKAIIKQETSGHLFEQAMKLQPESPHFYRYLAQAFLVKLVERGDIDSPDLLPEELPNAGMPGAVRTFLCNIEEKRFTGQIYSFGQYIKEDAKKLFTKLG